MRQTGNFFRSKKEMENSKKSQQNNTIQKMQNSLENLKVDLMQKNVNLVESKHTVMKDSNYQQRMFISSFQVTKSKESEYFKQTNRVQLPLIREEKLIKIESVANDPEAKGPNSIQNDRTNNAKDSKYKDRYFTVQELIYLENLERQKQKNQHCDRIGQMSPQKKQQAKQYVKENIKQIYQKNQLLLIEKQLADEQRRKKNHKNYLAIGSNIQLKLSKSVDNLKEDTHQVISPKKQHFQKLTSLHISPQKYHIKEKNGPKTQAKNDQLALGSPETLKLSPIVPLNIKQLQNLNKAKTLLFSNDFMQVGWLKKPSIGRFQQCHLVITINLSHQANEKMRKLIKSESQEERKVQKISIVVEIISVAFDICTQKELGEQTQKIQTIFTNKYPIKDLSQNSRRAKNPLNASQCQFSIGFIHNFMNGQLQEGSKNKGKLNQNQTEAITPKNKNLNIQQLEVISCVSKLSMKDSIIPDLVIKKNTQQSNIQWERNFDQHKGYKVIIRLDEQKPLNSPKIQSQDQPEKYIKISDYSSTLNQKSFKLTQAKIPLSQPYFMMNLCQENIDLSVVWNYGLINSGGKAKKIKQKDVEAKSISYHATSSQWNPLRLQFTTVINKNSPKSKLRIDANEIPDISIKCPQLLQSLLVHHCDNMKSEKEKSPQNQTYTIDTHGNLNIQGESQVQCYWQDDTFYDMKKEALKQGQPKQETETNQVLIFLSTISIHWHLTVITRNSNRREKKNLYQSAQKGQQTIKQFKLQLQSSIQQCSNRKNSIKLPQNTIFKSLINLKHLKSFSLKVMQHFQSIFYQP